MKKLTLALALVSTVVLVGCNQASDTSTTPATTNAAPAAPAAPAK